MSGWEAISTAPKLGGEEILVRTSEGQHVAAWFSMHDCLTDYPGWHVYDGHEWHLLQGAPPTQWKSLD